VATPTAGRTGSSSKPRSTRSRRPLYPLPQRDCPVHFGVTPVLKERSFHDRRVWQGRSFFGTLNHCISRGRWHLHPTSELTELPPASLTAILGPMSTTCEPRNVRTTQDPYALDNVTISVTIRSLGSWGGHLRFTLIPYGKCLGSRSPLCDILRQQAINYNRACSNRHTCLQAERES
jgi:hypothetical protein